MVLVPRINTNMIVPVLLPCPVANVFQPNFGISFSYPNNFCEPFVGGYDKASSFIWVDMPVGVGVRLHSHPYQEIFVIQESLATFAVGRITLQVLAGQIIIVPGGTPHKFANSGDRPLRQVDIHTSRKFITEWLEE